MRATSGRPMLTMYSFLSRTSLIVNDTTSSPILFMSSAQVRAHAVGDHLRLLHDLLDRELADDAAQMPFHHQPDQALALLRRLGQELLRRGLDRLQVRLHLDLRDRFDRHRDALLGVEVLRRRDVERHQLQRQLVARLDHREDDRAVPLDDPRARGSRRRSAPRAGPLSGTATRGTIPAAPRPAPSSRRPPRTRRSCSESPFTPS